MIATLAFTLVLAAEVASPRAPGMVGNNGPRSLSEARVRRRSRHETLSGKKMFRRVPSRSPLARQQFLKSAS